MQKLQHMAKIILLLIQSVMTGDILAKLLDNRNTFYYLSKATLNFEIYKPKSFTFELAPPLE
jgi:hypothetical protein